MLQGNTNQRHQPSNAGQYAKLLAVGRNIHKQPTGVTARNSASDRPFAGRRCKCTRAENEGAQRGTPSPLEGSSGSVAAMAGSGRFACRAQRRAATPPRRAVDSPARSLGAASAGLRSRLRVAAAVQSHASLWALGPRRRAPPKLRRVRGEGRRRVVETRISVLKLKSES